ncbi:sialic acid-binding Ig-like lectin 14 [Leuresthes tenuis]|uniref:sialic acid-binding Ig-like lectin 14 n=1 Tax=Leuresthes tenuis TaxID=355514 RepID=UPI003B511E36
MFVSWRERSSLHRFRMYVLIWVTLLYSVRHGSVATGASVWGKQHCQHGFCITLSEGKITAEAGLCIIIPCSFTTVDSFTPEHIVWYKCDPLKQKCCESDIIFHTYENRERVHSGFKGQVSLLEPDVSQKICSIMINDLKESDSGSYHLRVDGLLNGRTDGFTFTPLTTISVKGLNQKPIVTISPMTEGQQTTLTCTAPGSCSGSRPKISWMWRRAGENDSHITGNISAETNNLTAVTYRHSSSLTFNPSSEHHNTNVTCKINFVGGATTEDTVTLNVNLKLVQHHEPDSRVLPWTVAGISLLVNVLLIIYIGCLRSNRKKVKPNEEDRTYMSLQKRHSSSEYDVIDQYCH